MIQSQQQLQMLRRRPNADEYDGVVGAARSAQARDRVLVLVESRVKTRKVHIVYGRPRNRRDAGQGDVGQLGQGTKADSSLPVRVSNVVDAVAFDTYGQHGCAVRGSDDMLWCWGDNGAGQLGDQALPDSPAPIQRTNLEAVRGVAVGSATGGGYTCALDGSRIRCFGAGTSGVLGYGQENDTVVPLEVLDLKSAVSMDAQGRHACARLAGGALRCWGQNDKGQLGNLLTIDQNVPVEVSAVASASAVTVGNEHTCAIVSQGRVKCWGANDRGQLGDGGMQDYSPQARDVMGLLGVEEVGAGFKHTCARRRTGAVVCWGANDRGQLGNAAMGEDLFAPAPVAVTEIGPDHGRLAVALSVGHSHTCALMTDDTVWCWGANDARQLGDGTDIDRPFPVQVRSLFASDEDE